MTMKQVVRVEATGDLRDAINRAVEGLGGIRNFMSSGDKVLVKPNFNTADPFPASSDREFVAAFADLCHEAGAGEVLLAESSTYSLKTDEVMKEWGCEEILVGRPWLRLVNLDAEPRTTKEVPGALYLKKAAVSSLVDQVDRIFLLPCLKTHKYAGYTGALKLGMGLIKPQQRLLMHLRQLQEKIAELNRLFRADLVVMDARRCFITRGPSFGEVREPGLILASTSRPAIDVEGVKIIQTYEGNDLSGIVPEELPQIRRALEMGIDQ